jgi:eukaryotic-like serine/threonine-protein kinase
VNNSEAKQLASASSRLDAVADTPANPADIAKPGDVIAGKFRVERMLGAGGMGVVVEARDIELDDRVAIKLLLPAALERPDIVARFRREARAAVKIKSEHIARVIDVGSLDDGAPFIVMEYLEGYDLSKPIRKNGRISIPTAVDYVLQACEALAEAHVLGIVHRDIKPPNLFLTLRADGSPCIKVLDFGISKVIGGLDTPEGVDIPEATLTQTSVVLGSPRYMAPEQISKPKAVDARADIWGIGTTFYRLVTGRAPYEGSTLPEIFAAILMTPNGPPPIHQHVPDAPVELDAVIRRCVRINPAERWSNIGDLATALAPFGSPAAKWSAARIRGILESAGIAANVAPASMTVSGVSLASPASTSGASMGNTLETSLAGNIAIPKRNPALYIVGALAVATIVVVTMLFVTSESPSAKNATAPTASATTAAAPSSASAPPPPVVTVLEVASQAPVAPSASAAPTATTPRRTTGPIKAKKSGDGDELFDERN